MDYPKFIVSIQKEEFMSMQGVNVYIAWNVQNTIYII